LFWKVVSDNIETFVRRFNKDMAITVTRVMNISSNFLSKSRSKSSTNR
jgi:hypothetical protein